MTLFFTFCPVIYQASIRDEMCLIVIVHPSRLRFDEINDFHHEHFTDFLYISNIKILVLPHFSIEIKKHRFYNQNFFFDSFILYI